ncbi:MULTISPECIES: putative bifunctional diguanylate cyclase/phosphodiesterase [Clostridium]|uniref:putative bifunctional diguanylate cyclase/phosphodiesterase n=1 Tax=Clostridium TaxID=1485 RepID=UPI00082409D8|nr:MULTISPECIES: bifunctional diguanylate cyclase/phosphodiesterase [Clostridium]PJI08985.1 GGDEF domain-containing protein [Clostridium sp. CT7]
MWKSITDFTKEYKRNNSLLGYDKFAVYLIDISNFRVYNYKFGYKNGDILLRKILVSLDDELGDSCQVIKMDGDKFAVVSPFSQKDDIIATIKKIFWFFDFFTHIYNIKFKTDINMGISMYPHDGSDFDGILICSEMALKFAKMEEKTNYKFFDHDICDKLLKSEKIIDEITEAVENNEFELYYQPQVDINIKNVYGVEALLRWRHPKKGIIGPNYFIDVIEKNGMITRVGKFVIKQAFERLKKFNDMGYKNLSMSINISESQLCENSFLEFVEKAISSTEIDPQYVIFEIVERSILNDKVINILNGLRDIGIKIYIDDFGTMYSSLNYLYSIPLDGIKLDKSFIDKIYESKRDFIITKNIINLAEDLNLDVVAEGVEYKEQISCLNNMNCNKIQGFIFSKPVDENSVTDFFVKFKM